jgi:CheY-like chemotaxis protein
MKPASSILIVDDDTDDREIIRDAFASVYEGTEYLQVESGEQLMEYLHRLKPVEFPSLVLLDLNMPGMDGRDALREIKSSERLRVIPVAVFTTSSSPRDRQTAYALGANCFITKPDTFNKLVELARCITRVWLPEY